jgi:hypothetical protein
MRRARKGSIGIELREKLVSATKRVEMRLNAASGSVINNFTPLAGEWITGSVAAP